MTERSFFLTMQAGSIEFVSVPLNLVFQAALGSFTPAKRLKCRDTFAALRISAAGSHSPPLRSVRSRLAKRLKFTQAERRVKLRAESPLRRAAPDTGADRARPGAQSE